MAERRCPTELNAFSLHFPACCNWADLCNPFDTICVYRVCKSLAAVATFFEQHMKSLRLAWAPMLPHKIYDEFSPRRILQNIFGTVTCLCVHVCACVSSVCVCVKDFTVCSTLGIVAMNCNHNWAGQQLFHCDVAQHFPIFRFMREVPSGLSFILCRCCCCCYCYCCCRCRLVGCLTTWRTPFPMLQVCPQPVDELYNWNCFRAFVEFGIWIALITGQLRFCLF